MPSINHIVTVDKTTDLILSQDILFANQKGYSSYTFAYLCILTLWQVNLLYRLDILQRCFSCCSLFISLCNGLQWCSQTFTRAQAGHTSNGGLDGTQQRSKYIRQKSISFRTLPVRKLLKSALLCLTKLCKTATLQLMDTTSCYFTTTIKLYLN